MAIDRHVDPAQVPIPNPGSREAKAAFKAVSASSSERKLTPADVRAAYRRISSIVHKSPLDLSHRLSAACECQLFLKKEHVSIVGSYKERGALNRLLQLTEAERQQGVICSSAGNHAQAVAYHSTRLGIDGVIVMPRNAPHVKVQRVKSFGAKVVQEGESFAEAYEAAVRIAKDEGRTFIHAFNDNDVIAGQGVSSEQHGSQHNTQAALLFAHRHSCDVCCRRWPWSCWSRTLTWSVPLFAVACDAERDCSPHSSSVTRCCGMQDAVVVPVGGGGLIAGMALFLKHINPRIQVGRAAAVSGLECCHSGC